MDIEEDIKKLNKYIELVIDKDYCDCNELNVIIGKHCDGSKNVAYAIKNTLAEREEDKKRIKELEAKLEFKEYGDLDNLKFEEYMNEFIAKQKVKDEFNWTKIAQDTHFIYEKAICKTVAEKQKEQIAQENAKKANKAKNSETEITNLLSFKKRHAYA